MLRGALADTLNSRICRDASDYESTAARREKSIGDPDGHLRAVKDIQTRLACLSSCTDAERTLVRSKRHVRSWVCGVPVVSRGDGRRGRISDLELVKRAKIDLIGGRHTHLQPCAAKHMADC